MSVSLVYLPHSRGCLARLAELVVLALAIASVGLLARREAIECAWNDGAGTCRIATIGALELRKERVIEGIHALGHRSGTHLHLVTDARNKDDLAPFGMRQIETWDERSADAVETFLHDRQGTLSLAHGPAHPALWTALAMAGVLVFGWASRPLGFLVTIDRESRSLVIRRRGPFFEARIERYPLASVRSFAVEQSRAGDRVRLELAERSLPLTGSFSPGEQHTVFVERIANLLRPEAL